MASPFSVFRRNQKVMIAVLGVLAMFAFVFLPIIMDRMGMRTVRNPVVVKTAKFGSLTEYDVDAMRRQRLKILGVLTELVQTAFPTYPPNMIRQFLESRIGPATEESVVNSWLLAKHAERMGMVVSNKTINAFLKELTQDRVKLDKFQEAFKRSGFRELQFFNAMRDELAAMQLETMFRFSVSPQCLTPAQRWDYFKRVKQQATIEALPVPVANYIARIDEPSDEELKAFFEENKEKYPVPDSAEPGFREPQKIALEWLRADFDKFTAANVVTDAEVQERYEKNKDLYEPPEKKPEAKTLEGEKAEKPSAKDTKESKPAKAGDAKTDAAQPPPAVKTDVAQPPPAVKTGPAQPGAAAPPSDAAKEPTQKSEPEKKKEPDRDKKSKDTSSSSRPSPFVLTALLQEKPADQAKPAENPPPAADKAAPPADKAATADDKAATGGRAPEQPAKKPDAAPAEKTPTAKPEPAAAPAKPAEPKAGPSEATKTRIRREIAYEKIQKIFDGLRGQMEQYRRERTKYDATVIQERSKKEKTEGESLPPPPKLDFEKLAKEHGLSAGHTGLLSQWETQSLPIGASLAGGRDPIWHFAFVGLGKWRPEMSVDPKGGLYLFWKTDETRERVPAFEDEGVRERVLRAWKMIRARSLAMKEADSLAAEARKSKKLLKQTFADRPDMHVVAPPAFSWITFGNVPLGSAPGAARIGDVAGVDFAGEDFMRAVFSLEKGQVGTAFNAPQTAAYVIRLAELTPSVAVLQKEFEVDDFSTYAPAAESDRQKIARAWLDEIKASAGLEWKRKPGMAESGPRGEE